MTGSARLVRLILRRDRVRMLVWTLALALFALYFLYALNTVFDAAALAGRAAVMRTPTGIIMGGPGYGLDHYTPTVAFANEAVTWTVLAEALLGIFHVVRHTRVEEENGRSELVRASAVARQAPAVATMLTLGLQLAVIAVVGVGAMLVADPGISLADAFALQLGAAAAAAVFGAVTLVLCQVSAHARTATGLSLAVFAAAFIVRAAGDIQEHGGSMLSWFSPLAWAQQLRPFVELRWWPILLSLAAVVVLLALAAVLARRRDFGAGLLAGRPGRRDAPTALRGPAAMAWLQQRGPLAWTGIGLVLLSFGTGTILSTLNDMVADLVKTNRVLGQLFGTDPSAFLEGFLSTMALFLGLGVAAYAIVAGQRPRAEESAGRLELVLAAPVGRPRWLAAQLVGSAAGTVALLAASLAALWLGSVSVG